MGAPPLGVTLDDEGGHVAVVSRHASAVYLCLFDSAGDREVERLALPERLGDTRHGYFKGLKPGSRYGFRAEGPWDPERGHRFDEAKLLVDPHALAIDRAFSHHDALCERGFDTAKLVPKAIAASIAADALPLPPARPGFIYELQVKAFTRLHPDVPEEKRGTVAALAEPCIIEHLRTIGADTIELMPLAAWIDERHLPALGLRNGWGYNPVCFMAPDPRLAPGGLAEIRETVSALHRAGIRVILDAVFNHTGESDEFGATLSLRGLDQALYYALADGKPINHTGCGNTLALDREPGVRLVVDSLASWAQRTGIDGFRFDLATVMGRTAQGFDPHAPLLTAIERDPLLSQLTMIAEPWDAGPGGYRLGGFPPRWQEWNDRYRDDVRRFWRGEHGTLGHFATRIAGSSDVFGPARRPSSGINYLAAHDGFTLRDAVTFASKNNYANGEDNRDGNDHEPTWPGGDVRALLATLFLSKGTPMLTAGDEFGRTQKGNNNAYAQDNETAWLDWASADAGLVSFVAMLAKLRGALSVVTRDRFLTAEDCRWLNAEGDPIDWRDSAADVLGLALKDGRLWLSLWFNRGGTAASPRQPGRDGFRWERLFCSAEGEGLPPRSVALFREERLKTHGVSDDELAELARAAGIEEEWWQADGRHHRVSPDTLRHTLSALGLAHASPGDLEGSFDALGRRLLPIVATEGKPVTLGERALGRRRFHIQGEDGETTTVACLPGEPATATLRAGYYDLWTDDDAKFRRKIIVSPGACYLPDDIASGARVFGLASHLYALRHRGDGGIGDFETLKRFAAATANAGGRYAGINPLHHLFPSDRERASPYQPSDRRFIDPIYINVDVMLELLPHAGARAIAAEQRAAFARLEGLSHVDYRSVWESKSAIFERAFAEFKGSKDFDLFVVKGGETLRRHGAFEAARAHEKATPRRIAYRAFLQWIADRQLADAAGRQNLYRDMALGCAFDGGETDASPELFAEGVSLGAPPDPFAEAGQVWDLPPLSPMALEACGFEPWRSILKANMRHAAALRIDHILGFARQFWVPRGACGNHGTYVNFPTDGLIATTAIESRHHRTMIIGEDLGTIPDGLRDRLARAQILSYRVLWFEREGQGFKPASHYPRLALACLSSHDLPTFHGWRAGRDIAIDRKLGLISEAQAAARRGRRQDEIAALDGITGMGGGSDSDANIATHGFVASTPSQVMLIQADDLACETEPINVPGTDRERPNWRRRLSVPVDGLFETDEARAIIARVKDERPP